LNATQLVVRKTACNRDCPDVCTMEVQVDEKGRAVKLRGSKDDPITKGFLCERTSRFLDRQYSHDRLLTPQIRRAKDQPLQSVTWDEALDFCAERLLAIRAESGPAAILHYHSGGSLGLLKKVSDLLFGEFGPVTVKRGDICSGAGAAAQELDFGMCESHDIFDLHHSKSIVAWGKNVHASNTHLLPILLECRRKGAQLIGIDVVETRLKTVSDVFMIPRPGCDAALAFAVSALALQQGKHHPQAAQFCDHYAEYCQLLTSRSVQAWADVAEVSMNEVETLCQAYTNGPCATLVGWGMGRRRNGGATVRAVDALAAVTGNLGIAGGGVSYYFRRRDAFDTSCCDTQEPPRTLAEARLGLDILEASNPPIRAAWITAGNPVAMLPDSGSVERALRQTEFVVVVDTHATDTTELADVVLPTLTLLEDDDVMGAYGNHYLRVSQPTIEPSGQALHELSIWQGLAQRLGLGDRLVGSPRDWKQKMMTRLNQAGIQLEQLEAGPVRNPFATQVIFEGNVYPTESGKMNLIFECPIFPEADPEYPLSLLAVSTPKSQSSQWSVPPSPVAEVRVHSSQAKASQARLVSKMGSFEVLVIPDDGVHPSTVLMDKGRAPSHGGCANALVVAEETDIGGGAAYYDQSVRLEF
jgi:anaerobic selenocysteine-containing dehydrogenase